jgi:hypothetical protein
VCVVVVGSGSPMDVVILDGLCVDSEIEFDLFSCDSILWDVVSFVVNGALSPVFVKKLDWRLM